MRKILYSPGYGAGWTTWNGGDKKQKKFMLEYTPFVVACESADNKRPDEYARALLRTDPEHMELRGEITKTMNARHRKMYPSKGDVAGPHSESGLSDVPMALLKALPGFIEEWDRFWPREDLPYFGGLRDLTVMTVDDRAIVRVTDYDGFEKVEVRTPDEEDSEWI